ncbi:MAG: SDR family NAD(P)-dependent oxidoreductase [Bacteroidales bacterium]|nr:SDR family NAD(P)-dependent oxidoreductase [Bacteroidales bacterium]MCF8402819.1 SDR family NAD(P)-dependent oxidoreductase [Bacteroidales bacterium]
MINQIKTEHLETVINNHSQDMTNKVVVITGTTSGTGYVCAREVAKKGATVILLNRESERSKDSYKQLTGSVPSGKFDPIACDLQNFSSIRSAMEIIKSRYTHIDVLVNNAGVMALKDEATIDGYDVQMQTNCISHFLITKELFPLLRKSKEARIVNHSSMARLGGPLELKYFEKNGGNLGGNGTDEANAGFQGPRWERYHQTKLANCAFTYGLKKKFEEKGITNVIPLLAHPGLALTKLQVTTAADGGMESNSGLMAQAQTAEDGATGIIRAAMDQNVKAGDFFGPLAGWKGFPDHITPEDYLYSDSNININWEGCEKAVGKFDI